MTAVLLALATFASTMMGGFIAIKNQQRLHLILGLTAGVILGLVGFDILPEIFVLAQQAKLDPVKPMIALVFGFLAFHVLEKVVLLHHAHEGEYESHKHPQVGVVSALALTAHSFLDGVGIGLAFQVNATIGIAVAIAVIGHDFADGLNTVSLLLSHKNSTRKATWFLLLDASAPVLGAASTLFFSLGEGTLALYLGFFGGFLLYIGATDILPQAHEKHSSKGTVALTVAGATLMFALTRVA